MRTISAITVGLAIPALISLSCNSAPIPSGYWGGYAKEWLVAKSIDQGPWGGHLEFTWSNAPHAQFNHASVRQFAESNGWHFIDEHPFKGSALPKHPGHSPSSGPTEPDFMLIDSIVMRFDSGWIREDPGTGDTSTSVGYIQVSNDGSKMYVFHFWGNG